MTTPSPPSAPRTGGLAFGIPAQTGARAFNAEVAGHLRAFRDLIEKGEAAVVRFIYMASCPTEEGMQPLTTYQIGLRKTGKVTTLTIKGKHEFLPGSHLADVSGSKAGVRRRTAGEGTAAASAKKRRLQAIREEAEVCNVGASDGEQAGADDSGFDADASGEYEDGQYEQDEEVLRRIKKPCTPHARAASEAPYEQDYEDGMQHHHHEDDQVYEGYQGDESMASVVHVNLHPPTPRKPSKPSSRKPGPPRYSTRLRSYSTATPCYGLGDLREPYPSIPPSNVAPSEYDDETSSIAAGSEATVRTNATAVAMSISSSGTRRRSSRLASLPPGTLEQDPVLDAAYQLDGVALDNRMHSDDLEEEISYEPLDDNDVDMACGSYRIDYADPEEQRLALEQEAAEEARRQREHEKELMGLPRPPSDINGSYDDEAMRAWQAGLAASGQHYVPEIKREPGVAI